MTLANIDILQRKVNDELKKGMQETKGSARVHASRA